MRRYIVITAGAVVLVLLATCFFIVDETEYVVVTRFGDPVQIVMHPGLHYKCPWPVDEVVRFDSRLMVLEVPRRGEPDREYIFLDEETGIGKNVEVTAYACWRIRPEPGAVRKFLVTVGSGAQAEAVLADVVGARLGDALGSHDFAALVSVDPEERKWVPILADVRDACRTEVGETYGIDVVDVRIERLNFPDQNRRNVFERMRAERQRIASRYRSEGEEQATAIRAEANKKKENILANAYRDAERIRGQADAEAARIYAEAYGQDPEFYEFVRTLQTYEATFDKDTVLILSGDSEFLRLLNRIRPAMLPNVPVTENSNAGTAQTTQPASASP